MYIKMKPRLCFITNIGPHYRLPIFQKISETFSCDFYLGDRINTKIKTFDYNILKGYKETLYNRFFHNFYWQSGSIQLVNKDYTHYILDGEPYCLSSWIILLWALIKHKETIAWTHGFYGNESFAKNIIKKAYYKLFTKLMVYSEYSISVMKSKGFNPEKMYCIANSLDSAHLLDIRKGLCKSDVYSKHFNNNYPVVIYCGRIQKRKQLNQIIDSAKMLYEENCPINVIFVGKDIDRVDIPCYAKAKGIEQNVWMYGPCYKDSTLAELFYNASVCVSPGNIGLTAIHALSFGCPIITHNNFAEQMPEFEAIKPSKTGYFYKQGDVADLKDKIRKVISADEKTRKEVREEAFKEIDKKWNIDYQINVLKKVLENE